MKNSINPKILFYGAMLLGVLLAMAFNACKREPAIVVEVPAEAWGPDTVNYQVQRIRDDHTLILTDLETGDTVLLEIENVYSQAYDTGLIITLIKK